MASLALVAVGLSIWSLRFIHFSLLGLMRGLRDSGYLGRALPPSFDLWRDSLRQVLRTFLMAIAGTALAGALSIPVALLAARTISPAPWIAAAARGFIAATRAVPDLVFAVFFVAALSIGELPGVLALGVHSIGMIAKLMADSIEELDDGAREAALAAGAERMQAIANSVIPQVLPQYLSTLLYRLDINTRVSVVLGFVGAGGIGFELRGNLRNPLRYPVGMGQALMVLLLVLVVDQVANAIRRSLEGMTAVRADDREVAFIAGPDRIDRAVARASSRLRVPMTPDRLRLSVLFGGLGLLAVWACSEVNLNPGSFGRAMWKSSGIVHRFLPPDFHTHKSALFQGLRETLALAMAATFLGILLAIPYAFLVARNTAPSRVVSIIARFVQVLIRSIPELVIVLLFVSAVGLGPVPGAAALTIATFGFMGKLLADSLEALPGGPQEGVRSTGATQFQETASGVAPQIVPAMVGHAFYALDVNIRSSSILGLVGAGGVGRVLDETLGMLEYRTVAAIVVSLFLIVIAIEFLSVTVRKYLF